jgi:hypothetical protein
LGVLFLSIQQIYGQFAPIPDPGLRAVIEDALELEDGLITVPNLERLQLLDASFRGVQNLN